MNQPIVNNSQPCMPVRIFQHEQLSIIVPVYKSMDSVRELCWEICKTFPSDTHNVEVILVDDGNIDEVSRFLDGIVLEVPVVKVIHLSKNFGQHNAILAGVSQSQYPIIVTMDDDLQHSPKHVPLLVNALSTDVDIVYGVPIDQPHGWIRGLLSRSVKRVVAETSSTKHINDLSAFRVFRRSVIPMIESIQQPTVNIDQILGWTSNRVASVAIVHNSRKYGTSNYTFRRLVKHAVYMLLNFTTWPLRLSSVMGTISCGFSMLILVYVVTQRLTTGSPVPGFAFLASSVTFFGGVQLLSIGVIGEYIAQIFARTSDQRPYSIRNIVTNDH